LFLPARAYSYAEKVHRGTPGKFGSSEPFVGHPAAVATEVARYGDVVAVCGAYLHDTVEKTEVTADEVEGVFGPEIRELVVSVSDDPSITDGAERRHEHRSRALSSGESARLIYACDRLDGIRQMSAMLDRGEDLTEFEVGRRAASWRQDIGLLAEAGIPSALLVDLEREIDRLDRIIATP